MSFTLIRNLSTRFLTKSQVNDIHHAAVFGRPPHIQHSRFCDLDLLHENDFESCTGESGIPPECRSAFVHLVRLATKGKVSSLGLP